MFNNQIKMTLRNVDGETARQEVPTSLYFLLLRLKRTLGALRPRNLASIPAPLKTHPGALRPHNLASTPAPLKTHPGDPAASFK